MTAHWSRLFLLAVVGAFAMAAFGTGSGVEGELSLSPNRSEEEM